MRNNAVTAVILAAGRGSRMQEKTEKCPKCLLELAGKPLLYWQMKALRQAGIEDILVVTGYKGHMLCPESLPWAEKFQTVENPYWATSNMLRSLLCASERIQQAFASGTQKVIISYSDIVYNFKHIQKLYEAQSHISICFDTLWQPLWTLRFGDPLLDAETFRQEGGILYEIGNKPRDLFEIEGQYMGLLAFTQYGWETLLQYCDLIRNNVDTTDMTSFLRGLIVAGHPVGTVAVAGQWCEADNGHDLAMYEQALVQGNWSHDWR